MKKIIFLLIIIAGIYSCKKENYKIDQTKMEINDFIWKGLNAYYLWKPEISELSDKQFDNQEELNKFLENYNNPGDLFESLLYQKNVVDRWSWIVEDYVALEKMLKGVRKTSGMRLGLVYENQNSGTVFAYVKYVIEGSDAEQKGIKRGDVFRKVNGEYLNDENYKNLFNNDNLDIELAQWQGENLVDTGNIIHLQKMQLQENPIYTYKVIHQDTKNIGYLMYNNFIPTYDDRLNEIMEFFKSQQIDELILDLRYNSGGAVSTMSYLASMITGQFEGNTLLKYQWHSQLQHWTEINYDKTLKRNFVNIMSNGENINSLRLSRVYIIATKSSASASESLMNCLKPYINVIHIGTNTHGKYTASITLYDSDNFTKSGVNPNHTWAMQPIVLKISNAEGVSDFVDGLSPDIFHQEDYRNLGILGEVTEPMLNVTLQAIMEKTPKLSHKKVFTEIFFKQFPLQDDMQADDVELHLQRNKKHELLITENNNK